ncbi:SpoIIE family protein phosphatase [Limibacter armeniacum]|uniref:PP2C family protein-serine/threonine phosphatase n=1 Tax=Limibacter armeniacum TaxID=466084 RepID=UPI002FE6507C
MEAFINFENRIFKFSCLVCCCIDILRCVITFLFYKEYTHSLFYYFSIIDIIIFGTLFFLANRRTSYKRLDLFFVFYLVISISIHFLFSRRGHNGVMPFVQMMAAPLIAALVSWKRLIPWLSFFFILTLTLNLISYSHQNIGYIEYSAASDTFQSWTLIIFMLSMLAVTIVVSILRQNYQQVYLVSLSKRKELERKQRLLEAQKKNINTSFASIKESIQYAKRLQNTILPLEEKVLDMFPKSFVFFSPKDVVSGDFCFSRQINQYKIVIAADCTGHGVPGAIMSVLGFVLINQTIYLKNITDPAQILTELDQQVITSLKKENMIIKNRDGMDIAICVVDTNTATLYYAGAKIPLYYIQDGEPIIIKGDRRSIGDENRNNIQFTTHTIPLNKSTICYLYSDGFQDQFGGPYDKKYLSKNLRAFLNKIVCEPMNGQESLIKREFITWKGSNEQVDDVLIVGFRADLY